MANFFHPTVSIAPLVSIEVSSRGTHTYLDEGCVIDDFVKIKHVGGNGDIKIGKNCYINSGCVFYSGNGITFGESTGYRWGRFSTDGEIYWKSVDRETAFDRVTMLRHPQNHTSRKLFQSHHGKRTLLMETQTALGFRTQIIIKKAF